MGRPRPEHVRIAELEKSIAWHEQRIKELKEKLERIKNPPARKSTSMKTIIRMAKEKGITSEQLMALVESLEKKS